MFGIEYTGSQVVNMVVLILLGWIAVWNILHRQTLILERLERIEKLNAAVHKDTVATRVSDGSV